MQTKRILFLQYRLYKVKILQPPLNMAEQQNTQRRNKAII